MGQKKVLKNPKAAKREEKDGTNKKKADESTAQHVLNVDLERKLKDDHVRAAVLDMASVTAVLASQPHSQDVKCEQFSLILYGKELVKDTTLELTYGQRYGLVGLNGSGKSTILAAIRAREVPIPDAIDIWHLHEEAAPSDKNAVESVIAVVADEQQRLEALSLEISEKNPDSELLNVIGEKLDKLDPSTYEVRARELLSGLGFTTKMMEKATKDMSGGWRMRVALSQALFVEPMLLLMDEPTNHLDLGACVWLERHLAKYPHCLVVTSHSQDFLDGVCTQIMHLTIDGTLEYYGGNYSRYVATREENAVNQLKKYEKEQSDIKHLEEFIRSCGTFSNLRKQADSKQKIIDKMKAAGLTEKPKADPKYSFKFPNSEKLSPPVLAFQNVSFSYSGAKEDYLYNGVDFGLDCDSRVALVGPNGAGKSTLLKLMLGELDATEGAVQRHAHLRIGRYNQHSTDVLDLDKTPIEFLQSKYPDGITDSKGHHKLDFEGWRRIIGRFGICGDLQMRKMATFSGGMKSRVVFCLISLTNPHMLLLDEPTNHLDMECIDSLAECINAFDGGLVLVSHDFRLISQVAEQIWVCDHGIEVWKGDIKSYKKQLESELDNPKMKKSGGGAKMPTGHVGKAAVAKKEADKSTATVKVVQKKVEPAPAEAEADGKEVNAFDARFGALAGA
jgi:ATP-binding cassette subfamily F protein 2